MVNHKVALNEVIDDMVITELLKEEKYHEYLDLLPTFPQRLPPTVHQPLTMDLLNRLICKCCVTAASIPDGFVKQNNHGKL